MSNENHYCSFCGEHLLNRRWSHPGPGKVRICGECVALCVKLMAKGEAHWRPAITVTNEMETLDGELLSKSRPTFD
jgi:hypothetical protein